MNGNEIRAMRESKNLSQREVAQIAEMSQAMVSFVENDRITSGPYKLALIVALKSYRGKRQRKQRPVIAA